MKEQFQVNYFKGEDFKDCSDAFDSLGKATKEARSVLSSTTYDYDRAVIERRTDVYELTKSTKTTVTTTKL